MLDICLVLLSMYAIINGQTLDGYKTDVYVKDMFHMPIPILEKARSYSLLLEFSNTIVDKSLLIKELLEYKKKVLVITSPRGFGKTVNMQMLKAFLEIEVDDEANEKLPKTATANYKMFAEGTWVSENLIDVHDYGTPLLIYNHKGFFHRYQGQRPIIYINFGESIDINYNEFTLEIRKAIRDAFLRHDYLMNHYKDVFYMKNGTEEQINEARAQLEIFHERIFVNNDVKNIIQSIYYLSKMLYLHFRRFVIILIDDYDHFLLQVFKWVLDSPEGFSYRNIRVENSVLAFFRSWFRVIFEENEFCEKAILNGRTLFCKDEVFADVSSYATFDSFNNPFNEFYGFTKREVDKLMELNGVPPSIREDVETWYYGYTLNKYSNLVVYSPYDIAGFLREQQIGNYWENEYVYCYGRDIRRLFLFDSLKEFFTALIQGGSVQVEMKDLSINQYDKIRLGNLLSSTNRKFDVNDKDAGAVIKELCIAGYLTTSGGAVDNKVQVRFANKQCASVCGRIFNISVGNYSWLDDPTLFRFAPEYYDEVERIKSLITSRRPNIIFTTRSKAKYRKPTSKVTYFLLTSTTFPKWKKFKRKEFKLATSPKRRRTLASDLSVGLYSSDESDFIGDKSERDKFDDDSKW